jgi:transcription initiation factor TFIID TATA-box-binding protein
VNIVATADLKQNIDLKLVRVLGLAEYSKEKYGGRVAYFKTGKMNGKVSLFETGKMISIGTVMPKCASEDLNIVRRVLERRKLIKPVTLKPTIRNIVYSGKYDQEIDLEMLAKEHRMMYEPEQFPGAIMRIEQPFKAVILLFASGKAIVVGLTDPQQIREIDTKIKQLIEN